MADANNSEVVLVTEEDLQKMQQRLVELNAQVPALSQELNRTRADGDFSEMLLSMLPGKKCPNYNPLSET